jgi:hypothetical protein
MFLNGGAEFRDDPIHVSLRLGSQGFGAKPANTSLSIGGHLLLLYRTKDRWEIH